jgi:preprotein translocase subunit SecD
MTRLIAGILCSGVGIHATGCASRSDSESVSAESLFSYYLAQDEARADWPVITIRGEAVHVAREPILTDADLEHVVAYIRPHGLIIDLHLRPKAADRLSKVTSGNVGRRIAIFVNSDPHSAPRIRSSVGHMNGIMQVSLELERGRADELAEAIRRTWPPR